MKRIIVFNIILIACCFMITITSFASNIINVYDIINSTISSAINNSYYYNKEVNAYDDNVEDAIRMFLVRSVISEDEETILAKTVYGEDRSGDLMHRSAVIWNVFNRVDSDKFPDSVKSVVTHSQYHGYFSSQKHPDWTHKLVQDVAYRYALEKLGYTDVGRTLPKEYMYFANHNGTNRFRINYISNGKYWSWEYDDPYNGCYDINNIEKGN